MRSYKVPVIAKPKPAIPEKIVICVRNGKRVKLSGDVVLGQQMERFKAGLVKRHNEQNRAK